MYNMSTFDVSSVESTNTHVSSASTLAVSPFLSKQVFINYYMVNPFPTGATGVDFGFLTGASSYWSSVAWALPRKKLPQVWERLLKDLYTAGTLDDHTLLTLTDTRRTFEDVYQTLLEERIAELDYAFLSEPIYEAWAAALHSISERSFYRLHKLIIHKAHSIGLLSFMNPACLIKGKLECEYGHAIIKHLPAVIGIPDIWTIHNNIYNYQFYVIFNPRCDERCRNRIGRQVNGITERDIHYPSAQTPDEYERICNHSTHSCWTPDYD